MVKQLKKMFFSKDSKNKDFSHKDITPEKELKHLRKENEQLKKESFQQMLKSVLTRRSVRSYSTHSIDEKTLYDIIEASLNAPASGNIQNYKITLVKDEEKRKEIGRIALNQSWMAEAPVIAVVSRDDNLINQMYPQHGERYSLQNTSAFITTFLTLIHSSGYASCWVEACEEEVLKEYLGIPMDQYIDAILPIGFPMDIPHVEKNSYDNMIFFEKYGNKKK